jgi:hypothetical protein
MNAFSEHQSKVLKKLLSKLINQQEAEIIIPAEKPEPGFWFGGGKLAKDQNGTIWLSGRYRNAGDSRTGLEAGVRGAECAIFRSDDGGRHFEKVRSWMKMELSLANQEVISIEGTALHKMADGGWELFFSTERTAKYPEEVGDYQKPGTGVWRIDRMVGDRPDSFDLQSLETVLENQDEPEYLHLKDPFVYEDRDGNTVLVFCSHPFSWSSDNSGYALRKPDGDTFAVQSWEMVSRGAAWDIAVTRITSRLKVPQFGVFADTEPAAVYFYDGAECMRSHQENMRALKRPRGYSCEEIGGAFVGWAHAFPEMQRLSRLEPLFISPWGTGASRYVDCLVNNDGIFAIWQQSQQDGSQPLVRNFLPMDVVDKILSGNS